MKPTFSNFIPPIQGQLAGQSLTDSTRTHRRCQIALPRSPNKPSQTPTSKRPPRPQGLTTAGATCDRGGHGCWSTDVRKAWIRCLHPSG
ncbi:hypothetical protein BO83DRAFT_3360 [Aspergillus eucalypticola CBS 122712]|uniref:Uncharacterized protein n=1 Tax=Aspergillus eucalypticola (strain CBS 122712 / IBT 29274) TaxID=1448314 RepID=A0A317WGV3_ASPEC|nr:uncharacterized protein BO83DRAFT_3360 [Aspergillus eucalypticola CBS 122712]PWY85255.1 hypothetical protein BO83DRAFT_3360 [Aspergillus eucalypticola CBS 122712]